jgi:hypothetical protein
MGQLVSPEMPGTLGGLHRLVLEAFPRASRVVTRPPRSSRPLPAGERGDPRLARDLGWRIGLGVFVILPPAKMCAIGRGRMAAQAGRARHSLWGIG